MRVILLALCALALISCSQLPDAGKLTCGPIDGVEQVLRTPGVFIGDMHGTEESPAFLRDLSCHVVKSGRPLVVAMEYDARDQAVLDTFLTTPDEASATDLLVSTIHWRENMDGRASPAMRDALQAIRRYARAGGKVELLPYDLPVATWQERDKVSAEFITKKHAKDGPQKFWIVFGGNVHARKDKGLPMAGYDNHEPLGYQIRDWNLVHLDAGYRGGTGWGCVGGPDRVNCSVRELGSACTGADCPIHARIRLDAPGTRDHAYDGYYEVGRLTASPPLFWK